MRRMLGAVRAWWSKEPPQYRVGQAVAVCARLSQGTLVGIPATTVVDAKYWQQGDLIETDMGPRRMINTGYWYSVADGNPDAWFAERALRPIEPDEWLEEGLQHYHGPFTVTSPPGAE